MILWNEKNDPNERALVLRAARAALAIVAGIGAVFLSIVHYQSFVRPDMLASAGKIELKRLRPAISANTVLPASEGPNNAAAHYVAAVNSYARRRIPYLKNRGLKAFVNEPSILPAELRELELGALRSFCDFYERRSGKPAFTLLRDADGPWKFTRATSPSDARPYFTPLRMMLVAVLYRAEDLKKAGRLADCSWLLELVARVGAHLLDRPGCLMDFELGLEMQLIALRRLTKVYRSAGNPLRQKAATYMGAVEQLGDRYRRKYGQLDNPEVCALIAQKDEDPIWRMEAVASLRKQGAHHALGILEMRTIQAALNHATNPSRESVKTPKSRIVRSRRPAG